MSDDNNYMLCFACTYPGEPGCGCPDNDFYHSESYQGSLSGAEDCAKQISYSCFRGDFLWWVEDMNGRVVSEGGRRTYENIEDRLR